MALVESRLLVPMAAVALLAAACAVPAGGQSSVSCAQLCGAAAACSPEDAGAREWCLDWCEDMSPRCRAEIGRDCLACYQACDGACVEADCDCSIPQGGAGDSCTVDADCLDGSICYLGSYCVGNGKLRISLSFSVDSDFDLHLLTPLHNEISYVSEEADGGLLDVDQCVMPCGEGGHVENIVFREAAPRGSYEVWVVNYNGRGAGAFQLEVAKEDGVLHFSGSLPGEARVESEHFRFTVE